MATKKINYQEYLKNITTEKDELKMEAHIRDNDFDKFYKSSRFMIQRYLSMSHQPRPFIIGEHQIIDKIGNEEHYRYLMKIIPKIGFIKYIK
jgi:hypothetical protein